MTYLTEVHKNIIIDSLSKVFDVYSIILFGSAAKKTMRADSDVDLAFMAEKTPSPYDIFMMAQQLAGDLGREVDLIDFNQASTVFKAQILGSGILLLDKTPIKRQHAFMRALKEYAMLNDERKEILNKLGYGGGVAR